MSKKKIELTEEDKELFRNAVKDVKPIKQDKTIPQASAPKFKNHNKKFSNPFNDFRYTGEIILNKLSSDEWLSQEQSISFTQAKISRRILKQLKTGQISIDAKLDLHGLTGDQAIYALTQCILRCQSNGDRLLLIIHGKSSTEGKQGPILKNIIYQWLRNQAEVLAIQSAHGKHGGNGAVYVMLKRYKS